MIRVALAGPMGAGKSTVGAALAARLDVPFVDLDARIGDVALRFAVDGEPAFRALEREALAAAVTGEGVIALGGGTLADPRNRALLHAWEVYVLHAPLEVLSARIVGSDRPLAHRLAELVVARAGCDAASGPQVSAVGPVAEVVAALEARIGRMTRRTLHLSLGYDVVLAPGFRGLGEAMAAFTPPRRAVVVSNDVVGPLYGQAVADELRSAGWEPEHVTLPDGEAQKTGEVWLRAVDEILSLRVDRKTPVVALGGGVIGDMAGFAAASVLRGLPLVQVPTTLLAMVDSSVGGKTGFNTAHGKNLVGAFWQPRLVWAPFSALRTLPDAEIRSGLGEVVKHAVIAGELELRRLEALAPALAAREADALLTVVADSVLTKARIVEADPLEGGIRATLNLGHTAGHAIERVLGYGGVRHGEAVAMGLAAITRWGDAQGHSAGLGDRIVRLLQQMGLRTAPTAPMDMHALREAAMYDKKRDRGMVSLAIAMAPGEVVMRSVPLSALDDLLHLVVAA